MIRFIFTSSILNAEREDKYVERIRRTVKSLSHHPITFYVVENGGKRKTKLDTIEGVSLLYTDTNRLNYSRKGMNEYMDILSVGEYYNFGEEDIIIKLSGLYTLTQPCPLIDAVLKYGDTYDGFLKFYNVCTKEFDPYDCVLGLYALRFRIVETFNYLEMLNHPSMECVFAKFVREGLCADKLLELEKLGLEFQGDPEYVI